LGSTPSHEGERCAGRRAEGGAGAALQWLVCMGGRQLGRDYTANAAR